MAWELKYPKYAVAKVEGKNVKVFCNKFSGTTVEVGEEISHAKWEGKELCVTLKNGLVKRYSSKFDFK